MRTDLREIRWEGVDWSRLCQDRVHWRTVMKTAINHRFPKKKRLII